MHAGRGAGGGRGMEKVHFPSEQCTSVCGCMITVCTFASSQSEYASIYQQFGEWKLLYGRPLGSRHPLDECRTAKTAQQCQFDASAKQCTHSNII